MCSGRCAGVARGDTPPRVYTPPPSFLRTCCDTPRVVRAINLPPPHETSSSTGKIKKTHTHSRRSRSWCLGQGDQAVIRCIRISTSNREIRVDTTKLSCRALAGIYRNRYTWIPEIRVRRLGAARTRAGTGLLVSAPLFFYPATFTPAVPSFSGVVIGAIIHRRDPNNDRRRGRGHNKKPTRLP